MSEILQRRIKIVAFPENLRDAEFFVRSVVSPTTFKKIFEIRDGEILITGGDNKAMLIGKKQKRLFRDAEDSKDFFDKEFRIV